ncbi:MAG TPA: UDP-2,3-diacylglucosamine diphosphatase [Burkholderiaceae bacterium]|nr:UDP-2,3-diacylglucosamine diphosphatase [Burkholderiaceae bacterium]
MIDPVFISDLHLAPERPATLQRFFEFMRADAPRHLELVILGDLFEFWIGDDAAAAAKPVIDALAAASKAKQRVFLMHGNRDPLIGHEFARAAGATLLADPIIVDVAATPTLLSHGDAWCTQDLAYQQFRAMARNADNQRGFLAKSVEERIAMAKGARMLSDTTKSNKAMDIMDVTPEAVAAALESSGVRRIIHGHTHRPAAHVIDCDGSAAERWVLPDWDLDDAEPRGGYLDFVEGRPRLVFFD